jgi:hypothetical protein
MTITTLVMTNILAGSAVVGALSFLMRRAHIWGGTATS